jgi:hypothetical protein
MNPLMLAGVCWGDDGSGDSRRRPARGSSDLYPLGWPGEHHGVRQPRPFGNRRAGEAAGGLAGLSGFWSRRMKASPPHSSPAPCREARETLHEKRSVQLALPDADAAIESDCA